MANAVYRAKTFLLSPAELRFFGTLQAVVPGWIAVAPKVRLADVVGCLEKQPSVVTLGRISQKHLDFILCHSSSSRILAAIELDDLSHEREGTIRRDEFVNSVLDEVGVPLLRVQASRRYSPHVLRHQLSRLIQLSDGDSWPVALRRKAACYQSGGRKRFAATSSWRSPSADGRKKSCTT